ncbi:17422_t:CDS:2 [Dentiscutata heterogama]|uniref:17422_t:CDS:1 n=1 Tax=Dentiscutata heterogama TaxID=1316150 RepID=A0ACA9M9I4_9GLOM|nr:17422_t:CDS:2 [Dentiscutata heterogama]
MENLSSPHWSTNGIVMKPKRINEWKEKIVVGVVTGVVVVGAICGLKSLQSEFHRL